MSLLTQASLVVTPSAYKEGKLYSVIPSDGSGDMSVTRATTATRVNSAGLVELVPYNLLSWSQDFTNGWYAYLGSITATANYGTAPDGTNTSTRILFTSNNQIWAKAISGLTNLNGTFSVYIKGVAGQTIAIGYGGNDNIVTLQSGWNRYSVTGVGTIDFVFINTFSSTATDIEVWGGQVVEGSVAKPYQKTETRLNIPRLDYSNGTCPSLLVEPQRTNLLTYSSSFDNAAWDKTNCSITANNTTAPDGTTTADKLILANGQSGSSSDGTGIRQFVDIASGSYTYSIYAKAAEFTTIRFRENQVTGAFLTIDLTNGAITNGDVGQYINPTATLVSNGWYRITFQTPTLTALYKYSVRVSETGNGTSGIFIWGYQVELGSYATSYIPTTSASVTRNADVISKTGISSLIGQTEGTLFVEVYRPTSNSPFIFMLANSTGSNAYLNSLYLYQVDTSQLTFDVFVSGALQASIATSSSGLSVGRHKIAFAYKQNDFVLYVDGTQIGTDTSGNVPTLSAFEINGADIASASNVDTNAVALWKTRLTNTQLAALTTI